MNPRSWLLSVSALISLSAASVYAQGDIAPLIGADFPASAEPNQKQEPLDGPNVIFERPDFETTWSEGIRLRARGSSEAIVRDSIMVGQKDAVNSDNAQFLFFHTQSGSLVMIPFFNYKLKKAQQMAERLRSGESIDVSSCVVKERQGEPTWVDRGMNVRCRINSFKRVINCAKTDFTPTTRGYVSKFFNVTTKEKFESEIQRETDYLNCFSDSRSGK